MEMIGAAVNAQRGRQGTHLRGFHQSGSSPCLTPTALNLRVLSLHQHPASGTQHPAPSTQALCLAPSSCLASVHPPAWTLEVSQAHGTKGDLWMVWGLSPHPARLPPKRRKPDFLIDLDRGVRSPSSRPGAK